MRHQRQPVTSDRAGHSLLEAVIASGIFVMVAVALSGVWVMYGSALAKSGEHMAANHLARSVTEGLIANGYQWMEDHETGLASAGAVLPQSDYTVKRRVRRRQADIKYNVVYESVFNRNRMYWTAFSNDVGRLTVTVRWHSHRGGRDIDNGKYNNEVTYRAYVYKGAIN